MKIDNAKDHLLYFEPRRFIEKHALPYKTYCYSCKSRLTIDMASDFRAHRDGHKWALRFFCPVCKKGNIEQRDDAPTETMLYKQYNNIVEYYLTEYPRFYVWYHSQDEGEKALITFVPQTILTVITAIIAFSTGSLLAALPALVGCIYLVTMIYLTQSPIKRAKLRGAIRKKRNDHDALGISAAQANYLAAQAQAGGLDAELHPRVQVGAGQGARQQVQS